MASCEVCANDNVSELKKYKTMNMCPECYEKEVAFEKERVDPVKQENRLADAKIMQAQLIDSTVQIRQELFNQQTIAINEIKLAIEADDSIPTDKKHFKLYEALDHRVQHFRKVIFDLNEQMLNASTEQRAIQTYMNELVNKLRSKEREQFRLKSANYQPPIVKQVKQRQPRVKKFDKVALRAAASAFKDLCKSKGLPEIPESTIQMICTQRGISPDEAIAELKTNFGL